MPLFSSRTAVAVTPSLLWTVLVDKAQFPNRYSPDVVAAEILARHDDSSLERIVHVRSDIVDCHLREIVRWDPVTLSVVYKLGESLEFSGFICETIVLAEDRVVLEVVLSWTELATAVVADPEAAAARRRRDDYWRAWLESTLLATRAAACHYAERVQAERSH